MRIFYLFSIKTLHRFIESSGFANYAETSISGQVVSGFNFQARYSNAEANSRTVTVRRKTVVRQHWDSNSQPHVPCLSTLPPCNWLTDLSSIKAHISTLHHLSYIQSATQYAKLLSRIWKRKRIVANIFCIIFYKEWICFLFIFRSELTFIKHFYILNNVFILIIFFINF